LLSRGILNGPASMTPASIALASHWLGSTPDRPAGRLSMAHATQGSTGGVGQVQRVGEGAGPVGVAKGSGMEAVGRELAPPRRPRAGPDVGHPQAGGGSLSPDHV